MLKTDKVQNMVCSDTNNGACVHRNSYVKKTLMTYMRKSLLPY